MSSLKQNFLLTQFCILRYNHGGLTYNVNESRESNQMKNYSTLPTDENAFDLLKEDPLKRNPAVFRFLQLIDAVDENCSIALNGKWGSGKTLFVRQIKLLLDAFNSKTNISDEMRQALLGILPESVECSICTTVYYDAWSNDDSNDPILSLVYTAITSGQSDYSPEQNRNILGIAEKIAELTTQKPITGIISMVQGEDLLSTMKQRNNIQQLVREFINSLILERANRVVIFIDELDRCRPAYAVQLLERIKHYFDDDRITFVFSVDITQLQHTVKAYYGYAFDATRYLDKFFDLRVSLPEINYKTFIEKKFDFITSGNIYDEICIRVVQYFSFSLREVERYMRLIRIAAYSYNTSPTFSEQKALQFARLYIVPILIGLSMANMDEYREFVNGKNPDILCEILSSETDFVYQDWLRISNVQTNTEIGTAIEQKLREVYSAIFVDRDDRYRAYPETCIGDMKFTAQTRQEIMNMVALLAPCAEYDWE